MLNKLLRIKHNDSLEPFAIEDFLLSFEWMPPRTLRASTVTGRYPFSDEMSICAPVWLIMRVATEIAPIVTIEGEQREDHPYWRLRKIFWGDWCPI